ncbi:uncharacterized protein LOC133195041 [Saccostrea echinata]|uniref:uncharacterized protein LOC133195041 n=1 Tax=Saccostrea echinata TaxID=191078 RepID=UPI002A82686C|nr:uncharacterized protein LOC133195041 [Saccostrea echinata]
MDLWNVHEIDDITLSQAAEFLEAESNFENLSLSDFLDIDFGNFDILSMENIDITSSDVKMKTENSDVNSAGSRFGDLKEEEDINRLIKDTESKHTRKNSNWSKKTFDEWREYRTSQTNVPIPEIENFTENDVNVWLSRFVLEARRKDGAPYPPNTLYQLCAGLMRVQKESGTFMNFLDEKNPVFFRFDEV